MNAPRMADVGPTTKFVPDLASDHPEQFPHKAVEPKRFYVVDHGAIVNFDTTEAGAVQTLGWLGLTISEARDMIYEAVTHGRMDYMGVTVATYPLPDERTER